MPLTYISRSSDFENFYAEVLSTFTSQFGFLNIRDSCKSETLHSNCPWYTLQACTLTRCPWPIFHGPLTSKFLRQSLVFSTSEIAASLKPCIVIVLDMPFKHAPSPGALDLYFTVHWLWKFLRRSLVFSTSEIAASLKPCIVIVLDIPFELYFTVYWLCPMQVRYRPPRSSCIETWHVASRARVKQFVYKYWPFHDLDLFYGKKVNMGGICIWMGKLLKCHLKGKNLQEMGSWTELCKFWKKKWPSGFIYPCIHRGYMP